jgi:hypothetical protein
MMLNIVLIRQANIVKSDKAYSKTIVSTNLKVQKENTLFNKLYKLNTMYKILKIAFVLFVSLSFFACENEESTIPLDNDLTEALNALQSKGIISGSSVEGDIVSITYPDGIEINFDVSNKEQISAFDESNIEIVSTSFIKNSNAYELDEVEVLNQENTALEFRNPDHEGQDFCECYQQDVDEFCDGLIGCVALLHPLVQAVIVTHCVVETGTTQCED